MISLDFRLTTGVSLHLNLQHTDTTYIFVADLQQGKWCIKSAHQLSVSEVAVSHDLLCGKYDANLQLQRLANMSSRVAFASTGTLASGSIHKQTTQVTVLAIQYSVSLSLGFANLQAHKLMAGIDFTSLFLTVLTCLVYC